MDEVGIIEDLSKRLLVHHKLSTEDAITILYHLKSNFEELRKAELDGGLLDFKRKLSKQGRVLK